MIFARKLLIPCAAIALGFAVGAAWQRGRTEGCSEDIVRAEVALLEKHKTTPTCAQVRARPTGSAAADDSIVHWRYLASTKTVQRLVVAPDLTTGYEERELDCSNEPSN